MKSFGAFVQHILALLLEVYVIYNKIQRLVNRGVTFWKHQVKECRSQKLIEHIVLIGVPI